MSNFWVTGKSKEWEMGWLQTLHSAGLTVCIQYLLYDVPVFWRRKNNNDNFNNKYFFVISPMKKWIN